ncbi:MAG: J domain-containing protein [Eubacteriales bacterium]|nr:J domain-containing protein [Eubacteriales bacterium]
MIDYFQVLNLSQDAEIDVIKASYKALAKKYHPDNKNIPREVSEKRMRLINEAYSVLSDDVKREQYIKKLKSESPNKVESCYREEKNDDKEKSDDFEFGKEEIINNRIMIVIVAFVVICCICCFFYFGIKEINKFLGEIYEYFLKVLRTFT